MAEQQQSAQWAAARAVLAPYALEGAALEPVTQGLINLTFRVTTRGGTHYALQRLHPVFPASVNLNLAAVAAHLRRHGLLAPQLVPTVAGEQWVTRADGCWRLLSWVPGRTYDALTRPAQARAAGHLLGRFHGALLDFAEPLHAERAPVHDLPRHLGRLEAARAAHRTHRNAAAVAALSDELQALEAQVAAFEAAPLRVVHGDPKISNIMFDARSDEALCLIDLDTLARMPLAFELGDALRSWCNPAGEDATAAHFDLELFSAALHGYFASAAGFLSAGEVAALIPATLAIHVELAARFLADALEERYFAWDAARYPSRGAHNLARARGQLQAGTSLATRRAAAAALLAEAWAAHVR